jgi:16S rRNA (adenine(1408)-N(1))-methyltransferase
VASHVSTVLPWGSLLRAVALPDVGLLRNARTLCRDGATLEVVVGYDCERDGGEVERLALPELSKNRIECELARGYREAGFRIERAARLSREELRALPSTWAKKLVFGRERDVWGIEGRAG